MSRGSDGWGELPVQHGFIEAVMVGVIVTLPELSIATDDAMFMSRLRSGDDLRNAQIAHNAHTQRLDLA